VRRITLQLLPLLLSPDEYIFLIDDNSEQITYYNSMDGLEVEKLTKPALLFEIRKQLEAIPFLKIVKLADLQPSLILYYFTIPHKDSYLFRYKDEDNTQYMIGFHFSPREELGGAIDYR